jgi:hypothetical protein
LDRPINSALQSLGHDMAPTNGPHSAEEDIRIVAVLRLLLDDVTLDGITSTFVENGRGDPP